MLFVYEINVRNVNNKSRELEDWLNSKYQNAVIWDDARSAGCNYQHSVIDDLVKIIKSKVDELNKKYSRTLPFVANLQSVHGNHCIWFNIKDSTKLDDYVGRMAFRATDNSMTYSDIWLECRTV